MKKYFKMYGHNCELDVSEGSDDQNGWWFQMASPYFAIDLTSHLTLQHFNSYATIFNESKRHQQNYPLTVHPFSMFKFMWEIMMAGVFLIGLVYVPMMFFFYLEYKDTFGNENIMATVKFFCIADMVMRFFTGYWDEVHLVVSTAMILILFKLLNSGYFQLRELLEQSQTSTRVYLIKDFFAFRLS